MARRAVVWLSEQAVKLASWATTHFVKLVDVVKNVLLKVWDYAKPVLEVLIKVTIVIANPILLPIVIAGWGWRAAAGLFEASDHRLPPRLADRGGSRIPNLSFFGEAWPATKQKILATLGEVRSMDLLGKIAASDRVAKIMSGEDMELDRRPAQGRRPGPRSPRRPVRGGADRDGPHRAPAVRTGRRLPPPRCRRPRRSKRGRSRPRTPHS